MMSRFECTIVVVLGLCVVLFIALTVFLVREPTSTNVRIVRVHEPSTTTTTTLRVPSCIRWPGGGTLCR